MGQKIRYGSGTKTNAVAQRADDGQTGKKTRPLHLVHPSRLNEKLAQPPQRHHQQIHHRHGRQKMPQHPQPVPLEHMIEKEQNRNRHDPHVNCRRDAIQRKEQLLALRQKRVFVLLEPQTPLAQLAPEDTRRLLPQVRNLQNVRQDVIPVVPHQRVRVEQQRADRADKDRAQAEIIEQPRLAEPPEKRRDAGDQQLDVHPRRADHRPLPLVGQHPRIADVAIQARRKDQQHQAHLVALAAELFARQPMAELVQDFADPHRRADVDPVLGRKEFVERRQLALKDIELHQHQQQRGRGQTQHQCPAHPREQPPEPRQQPVQEPLGVDPLEAEHEDVGQLADPLAFDLFAVPLAELRPLTRQIGDDQVAAVQHPDQAAEFLVRDLLRRVLVLEPALDLVETDPAIQQVEEEILFLLKAKVRERQRILDNPIWLPLVTMSLDDKVRPLLHGQGPRGRTAQTIS